MSERPPKTPLNPESALLKKYQLVPGRKLSFEKISMHSPSPVAVGSITEGLIQGEVKIGKPINFDNGAAISDVKKIEEREGELIVHTRTSTYRLRPETSHSESGKFEFDDVAMVETAKGSTYRYLPDGSTQRFKKVEGREHPPQAALVYVPDYAYMKQHAPAEMMAKLGENEAIYTDVLLQYVQNAYKADKQAYIVDQNGKIVETNQEIKDSKDAKYLALLTGDKTDFFIPVSHKPKVGWMTFDTRRYKDEKTGDEMRELHLGNKVVRIILKERQ